MTIYFLHATTLLKKKDACVYGHEDCRGRENCEPLDGSFGECRCNRFLGFVGSSCDEPTASTYVLIAMVALVVASSVAAVVVRDT